MTAVFISWNGRGVPSGSVTFSQMSLCSLLSAVVISTTMPYLLLRPAVKLNCSGMVRVGLQIASPSAPIRNPRPSSRSFQYLSCGSPNAFILMQPVPSVSSGDGEALGVGDGLVVTDGLGNAGHSMTMSSTTVSNLLACLQESVKAPVGTFFQDHGLPEEDFVMR